MLLPKDGLRYMSAAAHEGKLVMVAIDDAGRPWYSVRQDGFEDSYLEADPALRTGWESWAPVDLPNEEDDTSVLAREQATFTREDTPGVYLLRSRYKSRDLGAAAPAQLVSTPGHLFLFRQSKQGTLLCDRFVLDGMTNKLGRKLEVRFKRSRKRHEPYDPGKKGALAADSLDFRDSAGNLFYEPTTELCLVSGVTDGWFSVVRVATAEHEQYRWHFFSYNAATKKVDAVSIRASGEGLFDPKDALVFDPPATPNGAPIPRSICGILRRNISVLGAVITGGPAATTYDLQQERLVNSGPETQLVRTATRLMLAVPTDKGTATWTFGLSGDGTLSDAGRVVSTGLVRSDERDLLLPLDTLDQIKLFGATAKPPTGTIGAMSLSEGVDAAAGKIVVQSPEAGALASGDTVEVRDTRSYNGLYRVSEADGESFVIEASLEGGELGVWEKREAEKASLLFDGMVTAYQKTPEGKLRVYAQNHGLADGDEVQIAGTSGYDGAYPVTQVDDETFVIERKWRAGEAVNIKLLSQKRRGLQLDGKDDYVDLPPEALPQGNEITIAFWAYGASSLPKDATVLEALDENGRRVAYICVPAATGGVYFDSGNGAQGCDRVGKKAQPAEYKGGWTHWAFTKNALTKKSAVYCNGSLWDTGLATRAIGKAAQLRLGGLIKGAPAGNLRHYEGTIADLAIYDRALDPSEIASRMYVALTGQEPGLAGYWRLGAVVEGEVRKVTDISIHGHDGSVFGGATPYGVTYPRTLGDGTTLAVKYSNRELIAVTQRATYVEEIDFRIKAGGVAFDKTKLDNAGGKRKPAFRLLHWGKPSRSAEDPVPFDPQPDTDPFVELGDGWFRASCRFTVPDGIALLRAFEIGDVCGAWDTLEIKRHAIRLVSDAVTEQTSTEADRLRAIAAGGSPMDAQLATIRADELSEANLFAAKLTVESKLTLLADAEYLRAERDGLARDVSVLTPEVQALESAYLAEKESPSNYYCKIRPAGVPDQYLCQLTVLVTDLVRVGATQDEFKLIPKENGGYAIQNQRTKGILYYGIDSMFGSGRYTHRLRCSSSFFAHADPGWKLEQTGDGYRLKHLGDGRYLYCHPGSNEPILFVGIQSWTLVKGAESTDRISKAYEAWQTKLAALTVAKKRLDELNQLFDAGGQGKAALEAELQGTVAALVAIQAKLAKGNAAYLSSIAGENLAPLAMTKLDTDAAGLETYGALLAPVLPASRISLRETCEGNVELGYIDAASRMRIAAFDATSDSRNTSFEQWLTDGGRACLSAAGLGTAATIENAAVLEDAWAIEAWVLTPLPAVEWTVLAGPEDQKTAALVVLGASALGLRSEGRFFDSGVRLDKLRTGWHHVAAAKHGRGKEAVVTFHVDGARAGAAVTPRFGAVALDGSNDAVELPPSGVPTGAEITIAFWIRSLAKGTQEAVVLDAVDAQSRRVLRIRMTDAAGNIAFDCGSDSSTMDSIRWKAQPEEYQSTWTHWAFTKNANTGLMRVYRNGRQWVRGVGKTVPLSAVTKVVVGRSAVMEESFYPGELSDLGFWNKELAPSEILGLVGRDPDVADPRLTGFWRFEGSGDTAAAKDRSKAAKDGTLLGGPGVLDIALPAQITVKKLGLTATLAPPPPLPPPSRATVRTISFDGSDDRIEMPAAVIPGGTAMSIAFWARGGANLPRNSHVLEALNAQNQRICGIHLGWPGDLACWDCGLDGAGTFDRIEKKAPQAEYKGVWAHWVFTKDCATGEMRIYRNGELWCSGTGKTRPIPAASKVMIGRSVNESWYWHGNLTELSIWSKALTQEQVKAVMERQLVGNEAGLVGYWAMSDKGAQDLSTAKAHGTMFGNPELSPPLPAANALNFNGSGEHVVIPDLTADFSQGITVEAWVWFDRYNSYSRILDFGNGQSADNIILCSYGTSSTLLFSVHSAGVAKNYEKGGALETGKWLHFAASMDPAGNVKIYKNGQVVATLTGGILPANLTRTKNYFGRSNWSSDQYFDGKMGEVRLWNRARTQDEIQGAMSERLTGTEPGLVGDWIFEAGVATDLSTAKRHGTCSPNQALELAAGPLPLPALPPPVFSPPAPASPPLKLAEVRIWGTELEDDEIAVHSKTLLTGNEPGLLAYLPMSEPTGPDVHDLTGGGYGAKVESAVRWAFAAPMGALGPGRHDALVSADYSTIIVDAVTGRKTAIMRRFYGIAADNGVLALPDKRIEQLDLVWIGNAQFNPTLLGYIEGAPPVPSENLTESLSYNGATSVELVTSEDVEYRWNRSQEVTAGLDLDLFIGMDEQLLVGGGLGAMAMERTADIRLGYKGQLNVNKSWTADTSITTRSSTRMTDRLELRGTPEQAAKFPHIGKRFVPKNVGYALVISGTADVFVTRLKRSGKMVGYQISPIDGVPPDVNTITFLMNPAYVMSGSLDGMTGSRPTSDRFYRHVPAMRAQYGGLYPASYYRLKEAYALKRQIENDDKRREAFFAQFDVSGLASSMDGQISGASAPKTINANDSAAAKKAGDNQEAEAESKKAMIDRLISGSNRKAHADSCFDSWQKKMERLQVLAGKRNIVNTYVWDADGGLRTEAQSFASTAEHTIGGSFSIGGALGMEGSIGISAFRAELTALVNASLTQTISKSQSTSTGIELNVDLSGVEAIGITNHDDMPMLPGEKVDRYRFMSFYLEGSTQNFNDFWSYVVDPEWLRSNGEEARALRQAMGKANKTWRVLHRVTYVERPALMGFGQDVRREDTAIGDVLRNYLEALTENQVNLQAQLDEVKKLLLALQGGGNP
ncbi:MAG: LamG domain-containing protein [Polyangiaceae bacterium]